MGSRTLALVLFFLFAARAYAAGAEHLRTSIGSIIVGLLWKPGDPNSP
jgi:hypothetical protein